MKLADIISAAKRTARPLKPLLLRPWVKSYGQYGEDTLLFAALMPGRRGFYVDVGAYDPRDGSNTYRLYKRGWSGVTVEPNPQATWRFRLLRGRDTHLEMGAAPTATTLRYYEFDIGMLNTMDGERAKSLEAEGHPIKRVRDIRCDRLDALLDEFAPGKHIDFLSVDCEGDDLGVIGTLDFERHRPTVVAMEDLEGYYILRRGGGGASSAVMQFMAERGYAMIAQLVYSSIFVALDWRTLNRRTGAFREEAIHHNLLPEGPVPSRREAVGAER